MPKTERGAKVDEGAHMKVYLDTPIDGRMDILLAKHGFAPCSHPDCGPNGNCATSHFHQRARALVADVLKDAKRVKPRKVRP